MGFALFVMLLHRHLLVIYPTRFYNGRSEKIMTIRLNIRDITMQMRRQLPLYLSMRHTLNKVNKHF